MNIMSIFQRSPAPAPEATPAPPAPPAPAPTTPPNPDVPAIQGTPQSPKDNTQAMKSPLDDLQQFLQSKPEDPNNPRPAPPSIDLDINKLQEAVKGMDFGIQPTPEQAQKLAQGDMSVLGELLNQTAQMAFMRAALANSSVSESLTKRAIDYIQSQVPGVVKQQDIQQQLIAKNPDLAHEAASPFVQEIAQRIASNNPSMAAQEVAEKTLSFLQVLGKDGNAKQPQQQAQQGTDWNNFFSGH